MRFEAVFIHLHPRGPKLPIEATAKYLKKSKPFVQHWVDQFKHEKNVNDRPNVKPERVSTSRENLQMVRVFEQNPGMSLDQGVEALRRRNVNVSRSTLRRRLIAQEVRYRSTINKPLLTEIHIEKRMNWATENLHTD